MRLHDRYIFRELLTPLAYCLGGFTAFWIPLFFFTEMGTIQDKKLRLFDAVEYCVAGLPEFFILVFPILLLLALLYALTHHARHNEITALRAAGVSLWRLCLPYFVIGFAAAGIYFALNELVVPRCNDWSEQILNRYNGQIEKETTVAVDQSQPTSKPKISHATRFQGTKTHFINAGFRNSRANRTWRIGDYDAVTTAMLKPIVTWISSDHSWQALQADNGIYTNGFWTFYNVQMFMQIGGRGDLFPASNTNISEIAMPEFDETPKQITRSLKFSDAEGLLKSRGADIPLSELWPYLHNNPDITAKDRPKLLTKFHGRIAAPWTCLVVVFIAIPFSAAPGRRNLFFGVAGSIFICFAYFILQQVGLAMGANGYMPAWLAAWLPNIIFAALGIILTLRIR